MKKSTIAALIAFSLAAVSCKDTVAPVASLTSEQKEFAELVEHAEIHFVSGPFVTVTGSNDPVNAEHTCYTVVSASTAGTLSYTVELEGTETEAERIILLDKPGVTVELKDAKGTEIHSHAADFSGISSAYIKQGFEFHGLSAGTYTIELANLTANDTLKLLIEHGGHDHAE